jgi:hypothetical protein
MLDVATFFAQLKLFVTNVQHETQILRINAEIPSSCSLSLGDASSAVSSFLLNVQREINQTRETLETLSTQANELLLEDVVSHARELYEKNEACLLKLEETFGLQSGNMNKGWAHTTQQTFFTTFTTNFVPFSSQTKDTATKPSKSLTNNVCLFLCFW